MKQSFLEKYGAWIWYGAGFIILLEILALAFAALSDSITSIEAMRIVFGTFYVLFIPGFIWTFVFFPKSRSFEDKVEKKDKQKWEIDWLERIALSFALSIALVPLSVFYLNLIGIKINLLNSFVIILGLILVGLALAFWRVKKSN